MRNPANKQTNKQTHKGDCNLRFPRDSYKIMWKYATNWSYKLENGTRRAQNPRKPLIFPSPNKQTNKQTKTFGHTEVRTLDTPVFITMLLPTEL